MPVFVVVFRRKQEFWFLHKVSIPLLLNPYLHYQLPIWSLAPKRRQIVHEIWKSRWRRVIFGSILVWGREGGAFTNGLPFYQRANWPREMSFLSQGQGYPAFVANFTIRQKQVSLFGFSFQLETTLQHIFSTKCPLESKTCQIHANQSLMLLKTCCCEQTTKSYKFQNRFWKT